MLPGLDADPFVDALALPLSAARVPVRQLVDENTRRGRLDGEYELLDTGIFDEDRYFEITVDYAKPTSTTSASECRPQCRSGCGPAPCAADAVVPQHMVVGTDERRPDDHR